MIMDGLDTLSHVALADQLNLSFDTYHPAASQLSATAVPRPSLADLADDNLNTPVTTSSDANFSFNPDMELSQEALPITATIEAAVTIPERFGHLLQDVGNHESLSSGPGAATTHRISYKGTFTTSAAPNTSGTMSSSTSLGTLISPLLSMLTQGGINPAQLAQHGNLAVVSDNSLFPGGVTAADIAESCRVITPMQQDEMQQMQQHPTPAHSPEQQDQFVGTPSEMTLSPQTTGDLTYTTTSNPYSVASCDSEYASPASHHSNYEASQSPVSLAGSPEPATMPLQYPSFTTLVTSQSDCSPEVQNSQAMPINIDTPPPPYSSSGMNFVVKQPPTYSSCSLQQPPLDFVTTSTAAMSVPQLLGVNVSEDMTYTKSVSALNTFASGKWTETQTQSLPDFHALQVTGQALSQFINEPTATLR